MSIPVLEQVHDEVRRLSIAGSVVAPGDFRLKKLAPALEQAGKKAPVFAKVAQAVTGVVESTEKTSAQSLLELSTLVNAILYTQGETGLPGEMEPIETVDLGQRRTQVSAQVLKPLLEALSTTGSGRMKVVQEAYDRGAFSDLRLIRPALDAIDDPNTEIAEFVAEKILPDYGKAILGELRAKFDPKGRGGQVRRLGLLHRLDPQGSREIVQRAIDEGSQEVRVAAVGCLGGAAGDVPVLLEMRKSKAEKVRVAAYEAIAKSDDERAVAALCDAVKGNDLAYVFAPIQSNHNPTVLQCVLKEAKTTLDSLLAGKEKDKARRDLQVERMRSLLWCFYRRTDKLIEKFLLGVFADRHRIAAIKTDSPGEDLDHTLLRLMSDDGPRGAQRALVDAHATLDEETIKFAFDAAVAICKPAEIYDLFSPYLTADVGEKKKKNDSASRKRDSVRRMLITAGPWSLPGGPTHSYRGEELKKIDTRWVDLAAEFEDEELVQRLAFHGHAGANRVLEQAFQKRVEHLSTNLTELIGLLDAMVRVEHPAATDSLIAFLSRDHKWNVEWNVARLIPKLPKESLPKLEALLPTLPERSVGTVMQFVMELKNRP